MGFDEGYTRWDIYDAMVAGFVSSSREYIRGVKAFLMDLRTANAQFKVYCDIPWRMSCVEKMQSICLQHLHLGPWVCKELFTHPDFQMLNVEKSEMERILEAASHALKTVE